MRSYAIFPLFAYFSLHAEIVQQSSNLLLKNNGAILEFGLLKKRQVRIPGSVADIASVVYTNKDKIRGIIIAAKCRVSVGGEPDKFLWFFAFDGHFGTSELVQLGVQPPPEASLLGVAYLYGDSFAIDFVMPSGETLRYFTSSPPQEGKDHVGGAFGFNPKFLESDAQSPPK